MIDLFTCMLNNLDSALGCHLSNVKPVWHNAQYIFVQIASAWSITYIVQTASEAILEYS